MKRLKILAALLALLLVLGLAFNWIRTHGYIEITVKSESGTSLKYSLVNKENGDETVFYSKVSSVKKLVQSGEYEVYVQSETASLIANVSVKSFLATTSQSGALKSEDAREFVGYNPSPCPAFLGDRLYSHECSGNLNNVLTHVPATAQQPTYTVVSTANESVPIVGTAQTKLGKVILTGAVFKTEEELIFDYSIGLLSDGFTIQNRRFINQLPLNQEYGLTAYREGFLIYNLDLSQAFYFATITAEPEIINLPNPDKGELKPISLYAQNDTLVLLYSNSDFGDEPAVGTLPESEVILLQGDLIQRYAFKESVSAAALCGNKLCALTNSVLSFYDLKGKTLVSVNKMVGIESFQTVGNTLYFVNDKGIFTINPDNLQGNFSYSLSKYKNCGLTADGQGYILCLIDVKQNKVALRVSPGFATNLALDKRILALQSQPAIVDASIYKNILFVTPDIDPNKTEFQSRQSSYTEKQISKGRGVLTEAIKKSNLSTEGLTIINTTAPF